jgi:hypothetical protein
MEYNSISLVYTTVDEILSIQNCDFISNHVGIPFFASDLASCLYIVNPISMSMGGTVFEDHSSGLASGYMLTEQPTLEEYLPPNYFNRALAPIVKIIFDENVQTVDTPRVTISTCEWNDNLHFQVMTSEYGESPEKYEASLMSVTSSEDISAEIIIEEIIVLRNRVVGDSVGLFVFKNMIVEVKTSDFFKNGAITAETFTSPST